MQWLVGLTTYHLVSTVRLKCKHWVCAGIEILQDTSNVDPAQVSKRRQQINRNVLVNLLFLRGLMLKFKYFLLCIDKLSLSDTCHGWKPSNNQSFTHLAVVSGSKDLGLLCDHQPVSRPLLLKSKTKYTRPAVACTGIKGFISYFSISH